MQAALDIAAYALVATVVVGVLLLGMLGYDIWMSERFRLPHPDYVRLPCTALDAARDLYARMKAAYANVSARERRHLEIHLRRMQERVQQLEQKVFDQQAPYYKAVSRREKVWRGSKALYDQVRLMSRADRRRARPRLEGSATAFHIAEEGVQEEWARGLQRDRMMLEELQSQGVLEEAYIPNLVEQARAYAAKGAPAPEAEEWQEPGLDEAAPRAALEQETLAAASHHLPGEPGEEPLRQLAPSPRGIGTLTYDRLRAALRPLFGRKAPQPSALVAGEASPIPESAWTPAPPPPRVDAPRPGESSAEVPAPVPAGPPALFRQQDLLGSAIAAVGRRYADPTFAVAGLPRGILRQADLSRTGFAGVRFTGRHRYLDCRFSDADLSAILLEPQGRPHQFVRCDFNGARFDLSRIGFALFHECDLTGTRWTGARLERIRFSDCLLNGVEWSGAEFAETRIVSGTASRELDIDTETMPLAPAPPGGPEQDSPLPTASAVAPETRSVQNDTHPAAAPAASLDPALAVPR